MKSVGAIDLSQPKLPPQNLEAEQSVLGAILLDNAAMPKAMELLVEEDFYRTAHKRIYQAMLELSDTGEVIDHITLTERIKARGELEAVGGAAYLAELVQIVPSSANIRYHCKIVRDKAVARQLISTSTEILTRGMKGPRRSMISSILLNDPSSASRKANSSARLVRSARSSRRAWMSSISSQSERNTSPASRPGTMILTISRQGFKHPI